MATKKAATSKAATKKPAPRKKAAPKKQDEPVAVVVEHVEVYKDSAGEWRWRAKAGNHRIVSESGEGYKNRMYAHKNARSLFPSTRVDFI